MHESGDALDGQQTETLVQQRAGECGRRAAREGGRLTEAAGEHHRAGQHLGDGGSLAIVGQRVVRLAQVQQR